ncbi:MAG: response regulator [Alphaproteobacteria bacterium]
MNPHCILIIEPELPIRHPVAEYLRGCGYKVLEAVNTDEAMSLLSGSGVAIDVVLADVSSPGAVDGFGLIQWIQANNFSTKVLLAGSIEKVAANAAKLCEDGPKLTKPYHHQLLLDEIKKLLAAHQRANDPE